MKRNKALLAILIRAVCNFWLSLFLNAEFVIKASPTPAKTTKVAAAFPSKALANVFTQLNPFSPSTILKLTTIIPITANALAISIPIILSFTVFVLKLVIVVIDQDWTTFLKVMEKLWVQNGCFLQFDEASVQHQQGGANVKVCAGKNLSQRDFSSEQP